MHYDGKCLCFFAFVAVRKRRIRRHQWRESGSACSAFKDIIAAFSEGRCPRAGRCDDELGETSTRQHGALRRTTERDEHCDESPEPSPMPTDFTRPLEVTGCDRWRRFMSTSESGRINLASSLSVKMRCRRKPSSSRRIIRERNRRIGLIRKICTETRRRHDSTRPRAGNRSLPSPVEHGEDPSRRARAVLPSDLRPLSRTNATRRDSDCRLHVIPWRPTTPAHSAEKFMKL
jgi:hypothetical protein